MNFLEFRMSANETVESLLAEVRRCERNMETYDSLSKLGMEHFREMLAKLDAGETSYEQFDYFSRIALDTVSDANARWMYWCDTQRALYDRIDVLLYGHVLLPKKQRKRRTWRRILIDECPIRSLPVSSQRVYHISHHSKRKYPQSDRQLRNTRIILTHY